LFTFHIVLGLVNFQHSIDSVIWLWFDSTKSFLKKNFKETGIPLLTRITMIASWLVSTSLLAIYIKIKHVNLQAFEVLHLKYSILLGYCAPSLCVQASWNVMAHAQKPDFVFRRNGRVHLNQQVRQFSWLLAAEVCASAVVMLDTPCSKVVWRVLATHSIRQSPLQFPSHASPCAITLQLESTLPSKHPVMEHKLPEEWNYQTITQIKKKIFKGWKQGRCGLHHDFFPTGSARRFCYKVSFTI